MKSIERKKSHGEVFTPRKLVLEMLEKIELNPDKTYLDNSCGNGQFLIELLKRDIPLENIYGVDIQRDNVMDAIARLVIFETHGIDVVNENAEALYAIEEIFSDDGEYLYSEYHYPTGIVFIKIDKEFSKDDVDFMCYSWDNKNWINVENIVRADALKYDYKFQKTKSILTF